MRIIKVPSSLWSLTLQAQAQASLSLLYSPSGDPSCLAKDFSHKKSSRDFIEPYSRGIPHTFSVVASLQLVFPQHNIFWGDHGSPRGSPVSTITFFMLSILTSFTYPSLTDIFFISPVSPVSWPHPYPMYPYIGFKFTILMTSTLPWCVGAQPTYSP
jgi:hypothetical protein